jgi:hypothetical protein
VLSKQKVKHGLFTPTMTLSRNVLLCYLLLLCLATLLCVAADDDETTRTDPLSQATAGITTLMNSLTERLTSFTTDMTYYSNTFKNYTNDLHYHYVPTWLSRSEHAADEM